MIEVCEHCGVSLLAEPVAADEVHYMRQVGFEVPGVYDGILFWACPDCFYAWPREFGIPSRDRLSVQHAKAYTEKNMLEVSQ